MPYRGKNEINKEDQILRPFTFDEENASSDQRGMVWPDSTGSKTNKIHVFRITDKEAFTSQMTSVVSHLLEELDKSTTKN